MKSTEFLSEQELLAEVLKELKEIRKELKDKSKTDISFDYVDNADLMKLMKVNARTLANWRTSGLIRYTKIGGKFYYSLTEIQQLLKGK